MAKTKEARARAWNKWYSKPENRARHNAKAAILRDATRKARREYINTYKTEAGCADCGIKNPVVLDFHHKGSDKLFCIGAVNLHGFSLEKVKAEIAKCDVVCANCHRIRHHKQKF